eukprot:m.52638 g.52638  ORF g.52638 m.52638 type:complete len:292 (+) comp34233_c0_seq2:257-1132(+)
MSTNLLFAHPPSSIIPFGGGRPFSYHPTFLSPPVFRFPAFGHSGRAPTTLQESMQNNSTEEQANETSSKSTRTDERAGSAPNNLTPEFSVKRERETATANETRASSPRSSLAAASAGGGRNRKRHPPSGEHPSAPAKLAKCLLQPLPLPKDPQEWDREQVHQWLVWAQEEFNLEAIDVRRFTVDGEELCKMSKDDFVRLTKESTGDIIHGHLSVLRKAAFANQEKTESRSNEGEPPVRRERAPYLSRNARECLPSAGEMTENRISTLYDPGSVALLGAPHVAGSMCVGGSP